MANVLIVEARFYDHLNDMLLDGARAALEAAGHDYEIVTVPGALESPARSRWRPRPADYDALSRWAS